MLHFSIDPTVRDCSAEAIGTLMKLVGEKAIGSFLVELEKDNLKMTKIKECCEKAIITVKVPTVKKQEKPAAASKKKVAGGNTKSGATAAKSTKRPASKTYSYFYCSNYYLYVKISFIKYTFFFYRCG